MPAMLTSYHVHSTYSDGENTVPELVEAAIELGLDELGISDHYVIPEGKEPCPWSMPLDRLPEYVAEVRSAQEIAGDRLQVRIGLETDFAPSTAKALADALSAHPFDYVIGSMHFLDGFPVDAHAEDWEGLSEMDRDIIMMRYWIRMADLAASGLFDFVGHIDICKKFGFRATIDLSREIEAALDAIAESGMAVEVNTSGLHMPAAEVYPSASILRECHARGIPVLVTSDAHSAASLTRGFEHAARLVVKAGYSQVAAFAGRMMRLGAVTPLP
jgi:histidinol-phosphatase (PHP family)